MLKLYNTFTRTKEEFTPLEEGKVKMYVCGITSYDMSHIGHARAYVAFDAIYRYLRYKGYDVTYVRNFTDVDDKIINRSNEEGMAFDALASKYIDEFYKDMDALNVERPTVEPRVSTHIQEIITLVEQIIANGHGYVADGDVYFDIDSFKGYGKLSGRDLGDLVAGASERVEVDTKKKNPLDFALWKAAKPGEPSWESPWGMGRPGWHIECSAMSAKHLGAEFDIHGGGKDLIFPHHENEVAQSESAFHARTVKYWMHNGFVNINQEKMSKSLGNFFTVREVLKRYHPQVLRFFLLTTHYRSPINYSDENLTEAACRVEYIYSTLLRMDEFLAQFAGKYKYDPALVEDKEKIEGMVAKLEEAMDDDFNTAAAIGALSDVMRQANELVKRKKSPAKFSTLEAIRKAVDTIGGVLGLFDQPPAKVLDEIRLAMLGLLDLTPKDIEAKVDERTAARKSKDFALSDKIRDELKAMGIELMDGPAGTDWKVDIQVACCTRDD